MNKIHINKPGKATVVLVLAPTGAYYETDKVKGISHFLEHMCFKGTKNRTNREISASIENCGGILNAFTDWELTCYWAKVSNKYKNVAIDVINDLATNPLIPKLEVDKERQVIIQELKMYADNPKDSTWDLFNKTIFDRKCGFYLPIVGTRKSLQNIDRNELKKYYTRTYKPLTQIIVGDVPDNQIIEQDVILPKKDIILAKTKELDAYEYRQDITQANILIGNVLRSPTNSLDTLFIFEILQSLFNDMSGRLFGEVREKNNLCYRVKFESTNFSNDIIGWYVSVGLEASKIELAKELIQKELTREIDNKELAIAVEKTLGKFELSLDNPQTLAVLVAYSLVNQIDYREVINNYEKHINSICSKIRDFIVDINFKNNILVGIVPKK